MGLQAALEMLLLRKPVRLKCHPLANYHYAGRSQQPRAPLLPASELFVCLVVLHFNNSADSVLIITFDLWVSWA